MTNYAYIRVSDASKQSTKAQEHVIAEYANAKHMILEPKHIFIHKISGSKSSSKDRGWPEVIDALEEGDTLMISDVDRMGRDRATGIIALIDQIIMKGATLILCRSDTTFNLACHSDPGKIFMLLGEAYAAVRFAEERRKKSTEAAARRKQSGLVNGRKSGELVASKLDEFENDIVAALSDGKSRTEIAKKYNVARTTLYAWEGNRTLVRSLCSDIGVFDKSLSEMKKLIRARERKAS